MTTCAPLSHLSWVLKLIAWKVPGGTHRACILCLCVPPLSCLVSWEIGQNFMTLSGVTWEQPERMVSPVWRRKCCLRNPECFCVGGHWVTAEINPLLEILPLVFIHREVGQRLFQHLCYPGWSQARESTGTVSSVGLPEVVTVPCSSCHPTCCDRESSWWQSQCCVWVVQGKCAISWQVGSVIPEEMGGR